MNAQVLGARSDLLSESCRQCDRVLVAGDAVLQHRVMGAPWNVARQIFHVACVQAVIDACPQPPRVVPADVTEQFDATRARIAETGRFFQPAALNEAASDG